MLTLHLNEFSVIQEGMAPYENTHEDIVDVLYVRTTILRQTAINHFPLPKSKRGQTIMSYERCRRRKVGQGDIAHTFMAKKEEK